jgi:hydrogenase maturation protein HypF
MTSGNLSDDPIAHTDTDALGRLGPLIDGLLTHDRPIHIRCDDSVVRSIPGGLQVLRRSRGYAPEPMALPGPSRRRVLAVGAELKNTIAVAKDGRVVASHHIGDLEHLATYQSFRQAVDHLPRLYGVAPEIIAHDLHPEYLSTKYALELDLPPWGIQHHHAHIASCLAEHGRAGPVLGLAFDGLGFGPDGTLWGGEFLLVSLDQCSRVGHLRPVAMPGGSAAIREPWRMAVSWAVASVGADRAARLTGVLDERTPALIDLVSRGSGLVTTSVGRLFDAVAALIGVRRRITYEGQAAIELEAAAAAAGRVAGAAPYPVELEWGRGVVLDPRPLVGSVISAMETGENGASVAASFHAGLAAGAVEAAVGLARRHHMETVALSGGVFQNQLLTGLMTQGLSAAGLEVLTHRHVPANDGGISIGQAAIASTAETVPVVSL